MSHRLHTFNWEPWTQRYSSNKVSKCPLFLASHQPLMSSSACRDTLTPPRPPALLPALIRTKKKEKKNYLRALQHPLCSGCLFSASRQRARMSVSLCRGGGRWRWGAAAFARATSSLEIHRQGLGWLRLRGNSWGMVGIEECGTLATAFPRAAARSAHVLLWQKFFC